MIEEYDERSGVTTYTQDGHRVEIRPRDTFYNGRPETLYDVVANWGDTYWGCVGYSDAQMAAQNMLRRQVG
jgi:hypothetical protein